METTLALLKKAIADLANLANAGANTSDVWHLYRLAGESDSVSAAVTDKLAHMAAPHA
ncbi:MAG: hypothetical protein ACXW2U_00130 [Telluria sp.]